MKTDDSKVNETTKGLVNDEKKLLTINEAAKLYIRVRTEYYKKSYTLDSKGNKMTLLIPWNKTTIKEDHDSNAIFKLIEKFENFANVPNNSTDPVKGYKRNINGCYNLYEPITHKPKPGDYSNTLQFLRHIFGEKLNVGLDWLTIVYRNPTQNLPAIGLVSKENGTGKTTFLHWNSYIYGANYVTLGNEDIASNFNRPWATKLLIGVDESLIKDGMVMEKIKRLITDDVIHEERKGIDKDKISWVGKFILTSNNERNFIKVNQEDTRFFVCKVPKIKKLDPFLLDKLISEIPAFLYFMEKRTLYFPIKEDRLWFNPKDFETEALLNMIVSGRSRAEKELLDWCERVFRTDETLNEIKTSLNNLTKEISKDFKYTNLRNDLESVLKDNWGLVIGESTRIKTPFIEEIYSLETDSKIYVVKFISQNARPYTITKNLVFSKLGLNPVTL